MANNFIAPNPQGGYNLAIKGGEQLQENQSFSDAGVKEGTILRVIPATDAGCIYTPTIFISYCHKDEVWKNRLVTHLGVLVNENILAIWDDRRIKAGQQWYKEIEEAIKNAAASVLLISANFLTSKFIKTEEIPRLLMRREKEGIRIFPLIVKPCAWQQVKWLSPIQARPMKGKPLSGRTNYQIEEALAAFAIELADILKLFKKRKV